MNDRKLSIAIPASVVSDTPHLREKTSKIGLIGRAAAIFRVGKIIIYPDNSKVNQTPDMNLIAKLLAYVETPQYLRKKIFKLEPELQYAGILPPLRTPHHPINRRIEGLRVGEYREGLIVSKTSEGALVDIGVEQPALASDLQLSVSKRVTVKIAKIDKRVEVEHVNHDEIPEYWGYKVIVENHSFVDIVKNGDFDLVIATSKYGAPFADTAKDIAGKWMKANTILIAFGAPTHGLNEIAKAEGFRLNDVADFAVNIIPRQGTETVRTEEALIASLAILNVQFCSP